MNRLISLIVRFVLFSIVVAYVLFPALIDSGYGYLVVLAVVLLIALMAIDGVLAAKKIGCKRD